jgi:2-polyprenyl-3-methyl-5-hydroxy-6-metoxy-1,4-benzoquinol methylase
MRQTNTDNAWKYFGQHDPYWGVVTSEEYRDQVLTEDSKKTFFDSGRQHVDELIRIVHAHLDPSFDMETALDFGCGVGRILIPLAKLCRSVVGIDISEAMLAEAQENCRQQGLTNVSLVQGDDSFSQTSQKFDFVHSYIVLQHIPPKRGDVIISRLLNMATEKGVVALQLTFFDPSPTHKQWLVKMYKHIPFLFQTRNLFKGRPADEPLMQMNTYDLNSVFQMVQSAGFENCYCQFTDHQFWGMFLLCQRHRN